MQQATRVNNAHITLFARMIFRIVRTAATSRWKTLILVAFLEALNAASKIGVVLIIALAVKSFDKEFGTEVLGYSFNSSTDSILIFGLLIGLIAVIGAISGYFSNHHSRRLGRWASEDAMQQIESFLLLPPKLAAKTRLNIPANLNILLTQLPLHTGLAHETIARMINPVMLSLFSAGALFYQNPQITGIAFALALLVIPFILKASLAIQKNAKGFYGEQALKMGAGVSVKTNMLVNQHGVINKSLGLEKTDISTVFFDSFDKNLMANHRTGLLIALLDAILRPILFIIAGSLVLTGKLTTDAAIIFLGSLAYLLASSRTALGLLTNLLRFQPQVHQYFELVDWLHKANETNVSDGHQVVSEPADAQASSLILANTSTTISTLTLGRFLDVMLSHCVDTRYSDKDIFFASSSFRFYPEKTIIEHLCGDHTSEDNRSKALQIAKIIGALDSYNNQSHGVDTEMNEGNWATLNSNARVALRTIPLALKPRESIIILDFDILKPLSNKVKEQLLAQFNSSILILIVGTDYQLGDTVVDNCVIVKSSGEAASGNKEWFDQQLTKLSTSDKLTQGTMQDDSTSLLL